MLIVSHISAEDIEACGGLNDPFHCIWKRFNQYYMKTHRMMSTVRDSRRRDTKRRAATIAPSSANLRLCPLPRSLR
jgi:hypothetical protein